MFIHPVKNIRDVAAVAWKNGGGTTRTLLVEPADAGLDDFVWRISMAQIAEAGEFSSFPEIDRTILLWQGAGVRLDAPEWPSHLLDQPLAPFQFRGEDTVTCELLDGPCEDLNLMTRRGHVQAQLASLAVESTVHTADSLIVLCAKGELEVELPVQAVTLKTGELLRVDGMADAIRLIPRIKDSYFVQITVNRVVL